MATRNLNRSWYIVIEGAIGVGKTTLARMLSDHFRTGLLLEVFEENPFLAKFYQSRALYAFQTQMFFLLSRYRQQQQVPRLLQESALFSDYMFAKDRLFAQLNLAGDEWDIYQQIQEALAGQIVRPDLIVYLQADTEVLMGRIAQRDRPYERAMERDYIEALRLAYDRYLPSLQGTRVLKIDTNQLNFVTRPEDFISIVERIRSVLKEGLFQPALPQFETAAREDNLLISGRPLADYQRYHEEMDRAQGLNTDLYYNYLRLSEEMGQVGRVLTHLWTEEMAQARQGLPGNQARQAALIKWRSEFEAELAECMAYLLKLANYAGSDLERAYLEKMNLDQDNKV